MLLRRRQCIKFPFAARQVQNPKEYRPVARVCQGYYLRQTLPIWAVYPDISPQCIRLTDRLGKHCLFEVKKKLWLKRLTLPLLRVGRGLEDLLTSRRRRSMGVRATPFTITCFCPTFTTIPGKSTGNLSMT